MNPTTSLSSLTKPVALIFDMDGVLVDSNPFHLQKWIDLLNERGIPYDPATLPSQLLGSRNDMAFRRFFGPGLTPEETHRLSEELEARFRRDFKPHARPLPGLAALIESSHRAGIPMAVASSAIPKNIEFVVDALGFGPYFRTTVSGDEVIHPKPDPEIYLKTAAKLGCEPGECVAFEDSFVGVEAAKRARMKCVAIASTFPLEDLRRETRADLVIVSFEEVNLERLRQLFYRLERKGGGLEP
jgi:HAD superfamily hydrolase (TIGR01509 family)